MATAVVVCVVALVVLTNSRFALDAMTPETAPETELPAGELAGPLRSRFSETANSSIEFTSTGNAEQDASIVLREFEEFWNGIDSYRVRKSKESGAAATLVVEKPNRMVLRYENWVDGKSLVSDGEIIRVAAEFRGHESPKAYLEGKSPEQLDDVLWFSNDIEMRPEWGGFHTMHLLGLLPVVSEVEEWIRSRGYREIELLGVGPVDQTDAYHIQCSDHEGAPDYPLNLWIAANGPPLLLKAVTPEIEASYSDWVLNPVLPKEAFELPPTSRFARKPLELGAWRKLIGTAAPDFGMELLDGTRRELSELRGQVVVLDFWATWCGPCLRGLPVASEVVQEFSDDGVELFAVTAETDRAKIRDTLKRFDLSVTAAIDAENRQVELFEASAIPHLVIIDQTGTIRQIHQGFTESFESDLRAELTSLTRADGAK